MTEGFGPKVTGFDHFTFGDHNSFKKKINKNTAKSEEHTSEL